MTETTETPIEALKAATEDSTLPLTQLALIGTVERPGETRALMRHGNNRIEIVATGDVIDGRKVVAIETGLVILAREGSTERFVIPEREAEEQQLGAA
ncbi:hypothetical protein [Litoreibacter janthinus]|uniref:Uncharacterized protein n=1 Tax=Litoreibacter janthinus TaxID=670154 RepID=A0A1I6GYK4_9RHOB|nr:hypothetical protein [Litoreibacter janthinus]SFR47312.1 hypothetical protein SAMN04488002_2170 [Litoreibacter janthinus]